jgi:hypothetical protein
LNDTDLENELATYGVEECHCDSLAIDANDSPCTLCHERVKHFDHVHYKGQLFHLYCLLLAVLRELKEKTK